MKIFLLSSVAETRTKIESLLHDYFEIETFDSGKAVLERLKKFIPEAIIMDHSLPDFQTFPFIDRIRNKAATRKLQFIIVSRESSNEFLEKAVRSGITHYIGVPFEPQMFVERVLTALNPNAAPAVRERRIQQRVQVPVRVVSFGRISYITENMIHLESHIRPKIGDVLTIKSLLCPELDVEHIEVIVREVGKDTFYSYPNAIDAEWKDLEIKEKIRKYIVANRHLNSPKKIKVLFIEPSMKRQEIFTTKIRQSSYSVRFTSSIEEAISDLPFMKPTGIVMPYHLWEQSSEVLQKDYLKNLFEHSKHWILYGDEERPPLQSVANAFEAPGDAISILFAVEQLMPPLKPDPNILYFSKQLEDSRVKFYLHGTVVSVKELGLDIELFAEIIPPCNLQIDLKALSKENLRNPYIRVFPPTHVFSQNGKSGVLAQSQFLGINDQQGQAVRQWLIDEELKNERKRIEAIPPKPTSPEEIAEMKKKEAEREARKPK